jgi:hypothetical protein
MNQGGDLLPTFFYYCRHSINVKLGASAQIYFRFSILFKEKMSSMINIGEYSLLTQKPKTIAAGEKVMHDAIFQFNIKES